MVPVGHLLAGQGEQRVLPQTPGAGRAGAVVDGDEPVCALEPCEDAACDFSLCELVYVEPRRTFPVVRSSPWGPVVAPPSVFSKTAATASSLSTIARWAGSAGEVRVRRAVRSVGP